MTEYVTTTEPIDNGPHAWKSLRVSILKNGEKIGEYVRNYHASYNTFCPFIKEGVEYALYSRDYTCTRVMRLPECEDIGGEDPNASGFCPVSYYIPEKDNEDLLLAFVSGCVWGDDTSWKLRALDLSRVEEGIISIDEKFGYLELWDGLDLEKDIKYVRWSRHGSKDNIIDLWIATAKTFQMDEHTREVESLDE